MDLTLLAPDLQERVLGLEAVDGVEPISERELRKVAHAGSWSTQRKAWPNPHQPQPNQVEPHENT
jgi:hypothetical protein